MRVFCQIFELHVICEWVHTCNDFDGRQIVVFGTHTYFNGCKVCHIDDMKNLLCVTKYTYIITLIMDKR
jgi:hypothetical protein